MRGLRAMSASVALTLASSLPAVAGTAIVINEVLYDSPGQGDGSEFVEIKGPPGADLNGFLLNGIDGGTGAPYRTIDLTGNTIPADGYFVVTNDAFLPNGDLVVAGSWENGPDEIELVQGLFPVDAVCYGSTLFLMCEGGSPAALVSEGTSLARCPDGADTNVNADDFSADGSPTPGAANDADCGLPTEYTLCELRQNDLVGVPVHNGERVRVVELIALNGTGVFRAVGEGVEVAVSQPGPERPARGDAGCCILLLDPIFDDAATPITEGDMITEVVGTVGQLLGVTTISAIESIVVSGPGNVPNPIRVATAELASGGEPYESCLIDICGALVTGGDPWPAAGGEADIVIDDGSGPVVMRIDEDTDASGSLPAVPPITVLGIAGQDDDAAAFDSGYLVRPRRRADIMDAMACPVPVDEKSWGAIKSRFR